MIGRLLLAIALASLLLSILPALSRTVTRNETDTSPLSQTHATESAEATTDSQATVDRSLSTASASNNDTTANTASSTKEPNASLVQPSVDVPTPIAPTLERIRLPGLFPVFYDGGGDSTDGCPLTETSSGAEAGK
jgi:hypothetical protein